MAIRVTDSSSEYLSLNTTGGFDFRSAYTITFNLYIPSHVGFNQSILLLDTINGGSQAQYVHCKSSGVIVLGVTGTESTGTTLSTATWYDIAVVRESSTSFKLYVNGTQSGSTITTNVSGWAVTRMLYVGTWFAATYWGNFRIENLKIFESALTATQIQEELDYFLPQSGTPWAYWRMDDGTLAAAIQDDGTGGWDFTAFNTPTIETGDASTAEDVTSQYMTVSGTTSNTNWVASSGTNLRDMVDETAASDSDYIYTESVGGTVDLPFQYALDPATPNKHVVRYRIKGDGTSGMTVALRQGTSSTIASWTHDPVSTSFTTYEQTLSSSEADSITDYTDLRIRFTEI